MVVSALKSNHELTQFPPSLIPGEWVWQNFVDAVNYIPFGLYAINSVIITVGVTIGAVISNTVVAYGFSRIQWPGRNLVFYMCIATLFLPYPVILVALFDIFGKLPAFGLQGSQSWVDTFLPLIVPAFFGNPFYIFLMRQFMLGIPRELSEAAKIDGASEIQAFRKVILPLAKPAVVVVAIFSAVGAWNEFLLPLLYLQDSSKYPLAVGLAFYTQPARRRLQPADGGLDARRPADHPVLHLRPAVLRRGHHRRRSQGLTTGSDGAVVAMVGGRPIALSRLEARLADIRRGPRGRHLPPDGGEASAGARRWIVQELVTEAILLHEAQAVGIAPPGDEAALSPAIVSRLVDRVTAAVTVDPRAVRALLRPQRRSIPAARSAPRPSHPAPRRGGGSRGHRPARERRRSWRPRRAVVGRCREPDHGR